MRQSCSSASAIHCSTVPTTDLVCEPRWRARSSSARSRRGSASPVSSSTARRCCSSGTVSPTWPTSVPSRRCPRPPMSCARWPGSWVPDTISAWCTRHRARSQGDKRERRAGRLSHRAFRHPRRAGRRAGARCRAGPDPDAARRGDSSKMMAISPPPRSQPQARRRLGDPVGLQHSRGRRRRCRGAVRSRSRLLLRRQPAPCSSRIGRSTRTRPSS